MVKKIIVVLYVSLIVVMGGATFLEKYNGTEYVSETIYGSWWFSLLWAVAVAFGVFWFLRQRVRRVSTICLHLSFVIILAGAFATHMLAERGIVPLRENEVSEKYISESGQEKNFPFKLLLKQFSVIYHKGTTAPEDYVSDIMIMDGSSERLVRISMNHIYQHGAMRLYLKNYDEDLHGVMLSVNSDPIGIPLTYVGYALLFFSLLWMLVDKNGSYRKLLRGSRMLLLLTLWLVPWFGMTAQHTLPRQTADELGRLFVVYNDRVCPMETFARDFTKKLYGKPSYKDFSACQVMAGFMFWGKEWMAQPVLKIKQGVLRTQLGLPKYVAPVSFFKTEGYILGPYVQMDTKDKFHEQVMDIDDKLMLIMQVQHMEPLSMFPYAFKGGAVKWFSPAGELPPEMPEEQKKYVQEIIPLIGKYAVQGEFKVVDEALGKIRKYQYRYGAASLPSALQVWAENVYNRIPFATILFMANLTLALLSLFFLSRRRWDCIFTLLMFLSFAALTFCLALRWIISGTVPMNNGYETTLVMAWFVLLLSLLMYRRLRLMITFGFLMSGFMLLVSHIGQMNPAITHRMPVLNSPLLSTHVSIIMIAYALLALMFIVSLACLVIRCFKRNPALEEQLIWLNCIFLYPAMAFLGIGIFVGAIWANVSWGTYWGWDPKEVWALITFMVYAVPLHRQSFPCFQKPLCFHLYMILAFSTVLMTYFGVNYFLGGMHSYA